MRSREDLLNRLVADLEPVPRTADVRLWTTGWLLVSAACVMLLTHLAGPIRPTALTQLASYPRFQLEMAMGAMTAAGLCFLAFRAAIPGAFRPWLVWPVMITAVGWLAAIALGLVVPALEPSMLGKRDHCYLETVLYGLPPLVAALYWQSRQYPLQAGVSAVLAGLAAGSLPALYMQIACMYAPSHILAFHIGPGILLGLMAPLLLLAWQRWRFSAGSAGTG